MKNSFLFKVIATTVLALLSMTEVLGATVPLQIAIHEYEPYFYRKDGKWTGVALVKMVEDLRKLEKQMIAANQLAGPFDIRFVASNNERTVRSVKDKKNGVDIGANLGEGFKQELADYCWSKPYIKFQCIAPVKNSAKKIESFSDLANLRLVSFQGAKNYLSPEYGEAVSKAKSYEELADFSGGIDMFLMGRVDTIVGAKEIFEHVFSQKGVDLSQYHWKEDLIPANYTFLVFKSEAMCKAFNSIVQ